MLLLLVLDALAVAGLRASLQRQPVAASDAAVVVLIRCSTGSWQLVLMACMLLCCRFMEDQIHDKEVLIEKLTLKNTTNKAAIAKLEAQLAHKEEMGEVGVQMKTSVAWLHGPIGSKGSCAHAVTWVQLPSVSSLQLAHCIQ